MKLSVTTQPQQIGSAILHNVAVYNTGPDTVYLDSDGTVSADLSMPLPPLTYVVWYTGLPLWVVSRGNSVIQITNASDTPIMGDTSKQRVIARTTSVTPDGSDLSPIHGRVETGSYKSLSINFSTNQSYDMAKAFVVRLDWFDSDGTFLISATYNPGYARNSATSDRVRLTVPVQGSFVIPYIYLPSISTMVIKDYVLTGITDQVPQVLEPQYTHGVFSNSKDIPVFGSGIGSTNLRWGSDFAVFEHVPWSDIAFHSRTQNLRILFDLGGVPSVAGTFVLRQSATDSAICVVQNLVAGTRRQQFDFLVPVSVQCYLQIVTPPTVVGINPLTHFIWS